MTTSSNGDEPEKLSDNLYYIENSKKKLEKRQEMCVPMWGCISTKWYRI